MTLHLNKIESPSPKYALCQVWLKLVQWFWRERFLNFLKVYLIFRYYVPFNKGVALHFNKLEYPFPKDSLCQVWLKNASCSGEEDENVKKSLQTDGQMTDK